MQLTADYHTHSNYSDGRPLPRMVSAAEDAGLEAYGIADHCNVSRRDDPDRWKRVYGFNLDVTYERRREAIESLREWSDLTLYDAVEMDYDARDEDAIAAFLEDAGFDYAIGSAHDVDGTNVFDRATFAEWSESERRAFVDDYYGKVVSLIESELFDVVAHVDVVERTPELRGFTTDEHYERVADALATSRTLPEINAGRALEEYGHFHPAPAFLEALRGRDVGFVPGSDSHRPDEIGERLAVLGDRFAELGLEPASPLE